MYLLNGQKQLFWEINELLRNEDTQNSPEIPRLKQKIGNFKQTKLERKTIWRECNQSYHNSLYESPYLGENLQYWHSDVLFMSDTQDFSKYRIAIINWSLSFTFIEKRKRH